MAIDRIDFDQLAIGDLIEVVAAQVPEGLRLDYKRDLYGNSDKDKREFLKDVSAMDFVHDQLATGRKIRVLMVVDTFSRYSPAIDPRHSYRGEDVVQVLEKICARIGYPATIRVDQGAEFVSRDLDLWAYTRGVTLDFSRPGKPTANVFIEAFNGRFRAECLNATVS